MAGGKGTRLKPHTSNCPKPMLKIKGKPMLEIILNKCIDSGFSNFYFSVNYLKEQIIDYFEDGSKWGIKINYLIEEIPLGTAGAIKLVPQGFKDSLLVGTFGVLLFAYVIRFLAVGKSPIQSSLEKQPETIDDTGKNLGLGPFNLLKKVHLPINKFALISAFIVTFIDIMKELPMTLLLRPFDFETLATYAYQFAHSELMDQASLPALIIIGAGLVPVILLNKLLRRDGL